MPGCSQLTVDKLAAEAREIAALGIPAVLLFGIPEHKDWRGSDNFSDDGVIPRAIRAIKEAAPTLAVISDMCFCEYTDHGHCGIINSPQNAHFDPALPLGYLLNDPTLELLGEASLAHARAGADIIAPSGMIDGMVAGIRSALDDGGLLPRRRDELRGQIRQRLLRTLSATPPTARPASAIGRSTSSTPPTGARL